MKRAEIEAAAIRQAQLQKLENLLIYSLRNGVEIGVEAAAQGLLRLGARQLVETYAALYMHKLPPFEPQRQRRHRKRVINDA